MFLKILFSSKIVRKTVSTSNECHFLKNNFEELFVKTQFKLEAKECYLIGFVIINLAVNIVVGDQNQHVFYI
jgi:hypothetical protein